MKKFTVFFIILLCLVIRVFSSEVKVLLYEGKGAVEFNGNYFRSDRFRVRLKKVAMFDGEIYLNGMATGRNIIRLKPENDSFVFLDVFYRGDIIVLTDYFNMIVINAIDMESYLKGVLPKEVSGSWPEEAVKAQAVAARTFAYRMISENEEKIYHLDATHMSQVYGGINTETQVTNDAVDDTRNLVLTYHGEPIKAFYHSSSGGMTANPSDVWKTDNKAYPYLRSFEDPYSNHSPNQRWVYKVGLDEIMRIFGLERLKKIRVSYSGSGHAVLIEFVLSGNAVRTVSGNEFRLRLGPSKVKSTLFKAMLDNRNLQLNGKGWGHGVGMSQWGAHNMALKGYSYKDILSFYYKGVKLSRFRG